jgi:MYXO-CTERM domain-containing protein
MPVMNLWRTLLVTVVALLVVATPAAAHVRLVASNPEPGAALAVPPQSIQLTFDDALKAAPVITVTDPNGTEWAMGRPTMDNKVVTVPCDPRQGPSGQYTINYRVMGGDGHMIVDAVKFTLTASFGQPRPAQAAEDEAVPATEDDGGGAWIWIAGVVLVAAGLLVFLIRRRTDKSPL